MSINPRTQSFQRTPVPLQVHELSFAGLREHLEDRARQSEGPRSGGRKTKNGDSSWRLRLSRRKVGWLHTGKFARRLRATTFLGNTRVSSITLLDVGSLGEVSTRA